MPNYKGQEDKNVEEQTRGKNTECPEIENEE